MVSKNSNGKGQLTEVAFVEAAIRKLRTDKSKGIHSVYSGFNEAYREYFGLSKEEGIEHIDTMVSKGVIQSHYAKGGVMLFLKGEMPPRADNKDRAKNTIAAIVG